MNDFELINDPVESTFLPEPFKKALEDAPAFTWATEEGEVLVCAGLVPIWKGLFEAWAVVSQRLIDHPEKFYILQNIYHTLVEFIDILGIRRIQADVVTSMRESHAFLYHLHFKPESELFQYGPNGESMTRFVWLAKDHL